MLQLFILIMHTSLTAAEINITSESCLHESFHLQDVIISASCIFVAALLTLGSVFNQQLAASNLSNLE